MTANDDDYGMVCTLLVIWRLKTMVDVADRPAWYPLE